MKRWLFLAGLLLELVLVFGLFIPYVRRVQSGTIAQLKTVPIDPRSIFRGDYVTLGYEAGMLTREEQLQVQTGVIPYGETVYVTLEEKNGVYERVGSPSEGVPSLKPGQLCLRGSYEFPRIMFPDIAQYFVAEGEGLELEQARNTHRLLVEAVIDDKCRAVITGIALGEEAPLEEDSIMFPTRVPVEEMSPAVPGR